MRKLLNCGYKWLAQPGGAYALLAIVARGRGAIALADQMMVSASNFATGIVLVRGLGLEGFGKYSIAWSLLMYANAVQMSFIASPMLSIAPLLEEKEKRRLVSGMLAMQILASILLFAIFALCGTMLHFFTTYFSLPFIYTFACCVGTYQLQDWLRRYYFLYNKGRLAFLCDLISYFVQLVVLFLLWRMGRLTLVLTFVVMCATSIAALIMGPLTDRLRPAFTGLRETWGRCKKLSYDLLLANQARWLGYQGVMFIGLSIIGSSGIGGLRATQSFAGPVFLILMSLENYVPIRIAEKIQSEGAAGAFIFCRRAISWGTVFFVVLIAPVAIFGHSILRFFYGPAIVAYYTPMLLQLATILVAGVATIWSFLYRGLHEARVIVHANVLSSIIIGITAWCLGRLWGASGIVLSTMLAQMVMVAYYLLYWVRSREELLTRYTSNVPHPIS